MTRTRSSIRLLSVAAAAVALSAASVTVASAAPRATTKSTGTVTLKIASTKPRIFHADALSGTAPTWAKTVTIQRRLHGSSTWHNVVKETVTKGKYKDSFEFFSLDPYDLRATANAVGKNKAISTQAVEVKPTALEYVSPTMTGVARTDPLHTGDAVFLTYSFTCPTGTAARSFGLVDLVGGEADTVVDDGDAGVSGSGSGTLETDGQLFGVEGIGLSTCTWTIDVLY